MLRRVKSAISVKATAIIKIIIKHIPLKRNVLFFMSPNKTPPDFASGVLLKFCELLFAGFFNFEFSHML